MSAAVLRTLAGTRDVSGQPDLSVVVLSWNTQELTRACLKTLLGREHGLDLEVIVVDNASKDGSVEMVAGEFPEALLVCNSENNGYAGGNNQGMARARAPYVLLLNSDTEVNGDAFSRLLSFLRDHPDHGAVAPRLSNPDGSVQRACMTFPNLMVGLLYDSMWDRWRKRCAPVRRYFMEDFDHEHSRDVDQPPGAAFLVRREVIEQVGDFDENLWLFFNDVDLCKRITRAGWKIHYLAETEILHHGGSSTKKFPDFVRTWNLNRVRYYRKHHGLLGAWVIKASVTLRALEEMAKVLVRTPSGQRKAGVGSVLQVLGATLRA